MSKYIKQTGDLYNVHENQIKQEDEDDFCRIAGKIDDLTVNTKTAPKLTRQEVERFSQIWYNEKTPHENFVTRILKDLNQGDDDILWK